MNGEVLEVLEQAQRTEGWKWGHTEVARGRGGWRRWRRGGGWVDVFSVASILTSYWCTTCEVMWMQIRLKISVSVKRRSETETQESKQKLVSAYSKKHACKYFRYYSVLNKFKCWLTGRNKLDVYFQPKTNFINGNCGKRFVSESHFLHYTRDLFPLWGLESTDSFSNASSRSSNWRSVICASAYLL